MGIHSVRPANIDTIRAVVNEKQAVRVRFADEKGRGKLLDLFTASAIIAVYDALSDANNKAKLERMVRYSKSFSRVAAFAFEHTR